MFEDLTVLGVCRNPLAWMAGVFLVWIVALGCGWRASRRPGR